MTETMTPDTPASERVSDTQLDSCISEFVFLSAASSDGRLQKVYGIATHALRELQSLRRSPTAPGAGTGWKLVPVEPTDAMTLAACRALFERPEFPDGDSPHSAAMAMMGVGLAYEAAINAAPTAPPAPASPAQPETGGVRVKPLEWRSVGPNFVAETPVGEWTVEYYDDDGGGWVAIYNDAGDVGEHATEAEAKAAAQADYEQRIRSALTDGGST